MWKRVRVDRDIVRFSLSYAASRALRRLLGKGDHEAMAKRIADETMEDFARSRWEVYRFDTPRHSTPPHGAKEGGSDG